MPMVLCEASSAKCNAQYVGGLKGGEELGGSAEAENLARAVVQALFDASEIAVSNGSDVAQARSLSLLAICAGVQPR